MMASEPAPGDADVGEVADARRDAATPLGSGVLLVLGCTVGNPLPVTCRGNLLLAHRAGLRFVDVPAEALDVIGLRGTMGQGPRGPVWMVGHGPLLSVNEHHATLSSRCSTSTPQDSRSRSLGVYEAGVMTWPQLNTLSGS
jgi:hypothetical protein